jgi:hypothetical protein
MGYRNYLYKIKKEDYVKGREFFDYDDDIATEIYELGKYLDNEVREGLSVIDENNCPDTECLLIDIESVLCIISHYAQRHLNFLNTLKRGKNPQYTMESHLDDQIRKWSRPDDFVYDLDRGRENIVNSWEFQYEIFDLVRIYKTFDTENYFLIWAGY